MGRLDRGHVVALRFNLPAGVLHDFLGLALIGCLAISRLAPSPAVRG